MKKLLFFIPFISFCLFGQVNEDSLNFWVKNLKQSDDYCLFDGENFKLIEYAKHKIVKDSLFIPDVEGVKLNRTAKEILKREYGLLDESPINGCIIPESIHCFETLMFKAVEHKYGAGFLDSISKHSILLDQIGKGYIALKFINDSLSIYEYLSKEGYELPQDNEFYDLVVIAISSNGSIDSLKFFKMKLWADETTEINPVLLEILNTTKWEPAYFKGEPIKDESMLLLYPFNFTPKN